MSAGRGAGLDDARRDRRTGLVAVVVALVCGVLAVYVGEEFAGNVPDHRGYRLVPVDDRVSSPPPGKPRHVVVVVVDGLRRDAAETMKSAERIAACGQCRVADLGTYTISRPEYALLSTGLEVERNGTRSNEATDPLGAQSIWEIMRAHGLVVSGASHLSWFRELFPQGFDRFRVGATNDDDLFAVKELADVDLFHPLYVDYAAHHFGVRSPEHRAAVARADREIGSVLDRVDLAQDLVVLTSDHGHIDGGGHGGAQPEVRYVLTCFGGPNVARSAERLPLDGRSTAPALALLMGLPFPKHMRAGEDALDEIFDLARFDPAKKETAPYLTDRRAAVARFRDANRVALEGWLGGPPGTWSRLHAREEAKQTWRFAAVTALFFALYAVRLRFLLAHGRRSAIASAVWIVLVYAALYVTHRVVMGDLDFSAINVSQTFFPRMVTVVGVSVLTTVGAHRALVGRLSRFAYDGTTIILLLLVMNAAHQLVYGWPMRYPLPSPTARYFPLVGSFALLAYAVATLAGGILLLVRAQRFRARAAPAPDGATDG